MRGVCQCGGWYIYIYIYVYYIGSCASVVMVVVFGKYKNDRINYV